MLLSLVYTYDASISISTSISTRNLRVNRCDARISALCLCLRRPGLHVRRNDASISTSTRGWNDFHSLVLVLMLASLRRTCKPGRRKHKHKRKERKLKNSDKLSAYRQSSYSCVAIFHHVGIKSHAKRQPGCAIAPNLFASALAYVTLCLCLSHV